MQLNKREFSQQVQAILEARIRMIWVGMKDEWEPKVRNALLPAADECLARLDREIFWHDKPPISQETLERLRAALPRAFEGIAKERIKACGKVLTQAISWQVDELSQTLTLNGLTGNLPDLKRIKPQGETIPAHLSGGRPLAGPVLKQCAVFTNEVLGQLGQARLYARDREQITPGLNEAADSWRAGLNTSARTTLYIAAARAQAFVMKANRG